MNQTDKESTTDKIKEDGASSHSLSTEVFWRLQVHRLFVRQAHHLQLERGVGEPRLNNTSTEADHIFFLHSGLHLTNTDNTHR